MNDTGFSSGQFACATITGYIAVDRCPRIAQINDQSDPQLRYVQTKTIVSAIMAKIVDGNQDLSAVKPVGRDTHWDLRSCPCEDRNACKKRDITQR